MLNLKCKYNGFSLIELLVVISLAGIIFSITVPLGVDYIAKNNISVAKTTIVSAIRTAQQHSINMVDDTRWGIYTNTDHLIMYAGDSYGSRDTDLDLRHDIPTGIEMTSGLDINFASMTGIPSTNANIVLSSLQAPSRTVQLDNDGVIAH
jgi:prepilin-type N-terminal cleavage/methylation domain-containing protein